LASLPEFRKKQTRSGSGAAASGARRSDSRIVQIARIGIEQRKLLLRGLTTRGWL